MRIRSLLVLLIFATGLIAADTNDKTLNSTEQLKKLQDEYWQKQLKDSLYLRTKYGLPIETLPDYSFETAKQDAQFAASLLDRLQEIDIADLTREELLSWKVLQWQNARTVQALPYFWLNSPLTPYASPISEIQQFFTSFQFKNPDDTNRYLALLRQFENVLKGFRKRTEDQAKLGIVLAKDELQLVVAFLKGMNRQPADSFLHVENKRLAAIGSNTSEFQKSADGIIETAVNKRLKELTDFLEDKDYSGKAPERVGLAQYPLGKDYYNFLVRYHTSMNVTPEQVHKTGLERMNEIHTELDGIRQSLGFSGSRKDFEQKLKKDPRFIPKSPEQIGETLMAHVRRIEPKIKDYFAAMPRVPYGVKRLSPLLEGSMTFGYYHDPTPAEPMGLYYYNGSNLKERSLLSAASLIYHELIPGHHFQISLQSENVSLPEFRRNNFPTAFVEGWAEYATDLAGEMGMYQDPYDRYGYLAAKAFLTARLVVDSGMNAFGWTRSQAMEYLRENTLMSETEINTETLRYCCDIPGQALAYRMGASKIKELREKARGQLNDRFNNPRFHDAVLKTGALPMTILEEQIDWFIQKEK